MNTPELELIPVAILQEEQRAWSNKNFPNNKPHHPLLGIVEELGELEDADSPEKTVDAIGDIGIYATDYANRSGLTMTFPGIDHFARCDAAIGKLCHFHLKKEQCIRYSPEEAQRQKQFWFDKFICHVFYMAHQFDVDAHVAISAVWHKVRRRDWNQTPLNLPADQQ